MGDVIIDFVLETAARDAAFTKMTTMSGNLSNQLRQKEDQIRVMQAKICNLKVKAASQPIEVKRAEKSVQPYTRDKQQKPQWPKDPTEKITIGNYCY